MKKLVLISSLLCLAVFNTACTKSRVRGCSDGWRITGYFTPVERDYPAMPQTTVNLSDGRQAQVSKAFLKAVEIEGWGKTNAGFYLGNYHEQWHARPYPLDAQGKLLRIGSVATDKQLIPHGATVTLPKLVNYTFRANDIGAAIKGKHIDIYCGEGKSGEQLTYKLTRESVEVCVSD